MEANLKNKFNIDELKNAWELIKKSKNITFLTHKNPDGDGVAACTAFEVLLEVLQTQIGKKNIETLYPNKPKLEIKYHPKNVLIGKHKQIPDLIIILDTAIPERFYSTQEFKNVPIINIDHHISNTISGKFNFIDSQASSVCEVLYELINIWVPNDITPQIAKCLLFGILYDSQVFHTQSTTSKTLRIAADLMDSGANLYEIKNDLLTNKNPQFISLWGNILENIKISINKNVAWAAITQKDLTKRNLSVSSLSGFLNFLSGITGIDICILFYETQEGQTKVSLRSKKTDINKFASQFGNGGGHKYAAGISIDKPIDEVVSEIITAVEKEV
jgi:bifunctional oligoribonuclease and PAP phosphatase NrnA